MNSRWLWNLHQRHKFLRAEASRDILKFRVSKMTFSGVFKRYFPPLTPHLSDCTKDWEQCYQSVPDLNLFKHYAFSVIQNWNTDALQFSSMVEGDESSLLRMGI